MNKRRPNTKTIQAVFEWLWANDMSVYGPAIDMTNKTISYGSIDYGIDTAIFYAKYKDELKKVE